ncbi:unnamed protein product [Penicillium pancosmium]
MTLINSILNWKDSVTEQEDPPLGTQRSMDGTRAARGPENSGMPRPRNVPVAVTSECLVAQGCELPVLSQTRNPRKILIDLVSASQRRGDYGGIVSRRPWLALSSASVGFQLPDS